MKNENYDEIFDKPFIFNLQTMSTARQDYKDKKATAALQPDPAFTLHTKG
jgi:hypothetical protein